MKFGVREICDVVFRAKSAMKLGNRQFYKNEPVIYFDTLTASSLEGTSAQVYAQGGRGYSRLIAWEGERTLTFNMTDALLSPEGFAVLSGAGLIEASTSKPIYVHTTSQVQVKTANKIILNTAKVVWDRATTGAVSGAGIFIMKLKNGEVYEEPCIPAQGGVAYGTYDEETNTFTKATTEEQIAAATHTEITCYHHKNVSPAPDVDPADIGLNKDDIVLVDYYVKETGSNAQQIEITADKFGDYFYVEASTLFRRESDGKDLAAEFVIPKAKVQSAFTFSMAPTGDPSTFDFVLDAMPDYTKFDQTKKVLAVIQVIDEEAAIDDAKRGYCSET